MKLSKKNIFGKYYNWVYEDFPKDLCSFFWGSLIIWLLAPIIAPGKAFDRFMNKNYFYRTQDSFILLFLGLVVWFLYLVLFAIGTFIYYQITNDGSLQWWMVLISPIIGIICILLTGGALLGVVLGINYLSTIKWSRQSSEEIKTPVKDFIGAIRSKYCTKIDWE